MPIRDPIARQATHEVTNQPPPLAGLNLYDTDPVLRSAIDRHGAGWAEARLRDWGALVGGEEMLEQAHLANAHRPELRGFDRYGHRIDEVTFHPAYHWIMDKVFGAGMHAIAWSADRPGGHLAHVAMTYLMGQVEPGVLCPSTMTYAVVPALKRQAEVAAEWVPRVTAAAYDGRSIPAAEKRGCTMGMAMTEKQGGSDVRANTTRAAPTGAGGPGGEYRLAGHKWFCSAPMSDAFLTLAYTPGADGLSCFLVPRWLPDGSRNRFHIQRLKDKLGDRANASSEIEYHDTWARMVGEEGRGVSAILQMVQHTRLDTAIGPAALMRQALVQAVHHARHRSAFQRRLIQQPLMRTVLADLALEWEAATILALRMAAAFDAAPADPGEAMLGRVGVAVAKYWINKRVPGMVVEAMECLGGAGYVEESILPRLYRQAPLNGIWEGSGNVICLDVLRALQREPAAADALLAEAAKARGAHALFDRWLDALADEMRQTEHLELRARRLVERMALALQASLMLRTAPTPVAEAFCRSRLGETGGVTYGTLPTDTDFDAVLNRAVPMGA